MPISTLTSKGQTTVPKEVREALDLDVGDKLTWEIRGGKVAVTTERPAFYRWKKVFEYWPERLTGMADAATVAIAIANRYGAIATFDQKMIKRMQSVGVESYW